VWQLRGKEFAGSAVRFSLVQVCDTSVTPSLGLLIIVAAVKKGNHEFVTPVSKQETKLSDLSAAIAVVTQDVISSQRTGSAGLDGAGDAALPTFCRNPVRTSNQQPATAGAVPRRRRTGGVALARLGCLLLVGLCCLSAQAQTSKEYQLKAAFVFNFTKFVEWTPDSFSDDNAPIVIGVFANSRYTRELEKAVKYRKVNGRSVVVNEIHSIEQARGFQMLVFDTAPEAQMKETLQALKDAPVLSIGESEAFAESDGILNFVREGDNVRFEINLDAAQRTGLKISAQFLKLAKKVRRRN